MRRRLRCLPAAATLVLAAATMGLLTGSGTATAAEPIVIGDCSTTVQGTPGTPVALKTSAVVGPVVDAVRAVDPLNLLTPTVRNTFSALPPVPIGSIPTGTGHISGGVIANAVNDRLRDIPVLGPVLGPVTGSVQSTLARLCGVTVKGVNQVAAPIQEGAESATGAVEDVTGGLVPGGGSPGPGNPGTGNPGTGNPGPGAPGGGAGTLPPPNSSVGSGYPGAGWSLYPPGLWNYGRSPMADYSSIPFATPGLFSPSPGVRYGGAVPGYVPEFGILGTDDTDGVQAAGHAEALHTGGAGNKIALPVLLAVFALSGVTAALVRTWVLRRTAPV